jgi:hypothetical protein
MQVENPPRYGTPFLESEAILAASASDENYLAKCLMAMSENELRNFYRQLTDLKTQVYRQLLLKEL